MVVGTVGLSVRSPCNRGRRAIWEFWSWVQYNLILREFYCVTLGPFVEVIGTSTTQFDTEEHKEQRMATEHKKNLGP